MAEAFATLEIGGRRVDFWVLEPVLNPWSGQVRGRLPIGTKQARYAKRYIRLRRDPSEAERRALSSLERLVHRALGLELRCSRVQLLVISRVGGPDGGWELGYRCGRGGYRVRLEPADLERVEVVDVKAGSARLRVPRVLLTTDLASGDDADGLGGIRP